MARKTATITIDAEGRDKGKQFLLTEMSAMHAERWAAKALFALGKAGVSIPTGVTNAGLEGLAAVGLLSLLQMDFRDAEPLLDEMLTCVQVVPDPSQPNVRRPLIPDDLEEVSSLLKLRMEIFSLHVGFSIAARLSNLTMAPAPNTAA